LTDCHDITSCNFESIPCLKLKSDGLPFKHKIAHLTADEHVHLPGHADARNFGKPPLENAQSNERAGGLDGVNPHGTILCSDEAKVYPSSCRKKESSTCLARTDRSSSWQKCGLTTKFSLCIPAQSTMCPAHDQKSLSTSLNTKDTKKPDCLNRKIWQHVRAWQWRWEYSTHHNLSQLSAANLVKSN